MCRRADHEADLNLIWGKCRDGKYSPSEIPGGSIVSRTPVISTAEVSQIWRGVDGS